MSLSKKLHPDRFTSMSNKMAAIVGYLINKEWVDPVITDIQVSGGLVLAQHKDDIGYKHNIGDLSDLKMNLENLIKVAGLTDSEERQLRASIKKKIHGYK